MSMVIKAGEAAHMTPKLSTVDLADHLNEAQNVVDAARREAESIMQLAHAKSEDVHKGAHHNGYELGYKEGVESGRIKGHEDAMRDSVQFFSDERAALTASLERLVDELVTSKQEMLTAAKRDLLHFAIAMASRLTYAIGELNHKAVEANFEKALSIVGARSDMIVRVHPSEVDAIRTYAPQLLTDIDGSIGIRVVAQDEIAPGGCIIETDATKADATLGSQLDELIANLLGGTAQTDEQVDSLLPDEGSDG